MIKITFLSPEGIAETIDAQPGQSVMEAASSNGIEGILADCGGSMVCGTCHAFVSEEWQTKLPPQESMELDLLEYVPSPAPNGRLTCQLPVTEDLDGIVFQLPDSQR